MHKSYQKVVDTIFSHMAEGKLIWHKPYICAKQANLVTSAPYNGINAFTTSLVGMSRGYESPYWATYNQVKAAGGKLVDAKGAGVPILFFKRYEAEEEGRKDRFVIRNSFVFNCDHVEGVDTANREAGMGDFELDQTAEDLLAKYIEREGVRLSGTTGTPCYIPAIDTIRMPAKESMVSQAELYSTFFHEAIHSTGHSSRLNRFSGEESAFESKENYSAEELVAEFGAAMLCHRSGVDSQASIKNSAAYIKGWSKYIKENGEEFVTAVNKAYKAVDLILAHSA